MEGSIRGGLSGIVTLVKTNKTERGASLYLADKSLLEFFTKCDEEFAEECRKEGCRHCEGRLHVANYFRKPRGLGIDSKLLRLSFCCEREGCRKRHTPASVRFLGPKVYFGLVVVLIAAMSHGLSPDRVCRLREGFGVSRRTLQRWRTWWLESFVKSRFWKEARARFAPALDEQLLPRSLCAAFELADGEFQLQSVRIMTFLRPLYAP
jgi:hypothetical protein